MCLVNDERAFLLLLLFLSLYSFISFSLFLSFFLSLFPFPSSTFHYRAINKCKHRRKNPKLYNKTARICCLIVATRVASLLLLLPLRQLVPRQVKVVGRTVYGKTQIQLRQQQQQLRQQNKQQPCRMLAAYLTNRSTRRSSVLASSAFWLKCWKWSWTWGCKRVLSVTVGLSHCPTAVWLSVWLSVCLVYLFIRLLKLTTFSASMTAQCLRLSRDYLTRPFSIGTSTTTKTPTSRTVCYLSICVINFTFFTAWANGLNNALPLSVSQSVSLGPISSYLQPPPSCLLSRESVHSHRRALNR